VGAVLGCAFLRALRDQPDRRPSPQSALGLSALAYGLLLPGCWAYSLAQSPLYFPKTEIIERMPGAQTEDAETL
jgi:hypothetical protein